MVQMTRLTPVQQHHESDNLNKPFVGTEPLAGAEIKYTSKAGSEPHKIRQEYLTAHHDILSKTDG